MCQGCKENQYKAICKNFTFKIAGITWKVIFVKEILNGDAIGICDYDDFTIALDKTIIPARQRLTFWHEVAHLFTRSVMSQDTVNVEHMADSVAEGFLELYPQLLKKAPILLMDAKEKKVKKEKV